MKKKIIAFFSIIILVTTLSPIVSAEPTEEATTLSATYYCTGNTATIMSNDTCVSRYYYTGYRDGININPTYDIHEHWRQYKYSGTVICVCPYGSVVRDIPDSILED